MSRQGKHENGIYIDFIYNTHVSHMENYFFKVNVFHTTVFFALSS